MKCNETNKDKEEIEDEASSNYIIILMHRKEQKDPGQNQNV